MSTYYRFDLFFSYWIFAWWFLFYNKIVKISPKIAIIIAILDNIIVLFTLLQLNASPLNLFLFFIQLILIKLIPLYSIKDISIDWNNEIKYFIYLFIIFNIWLSLNDTSFHNQTIKQLNTFKGLDELSGDTTPLMALLYDIYSSPKIIKGNKLIK